MIETTLRIEFIPGTNLQGDMVFADWRFLLPTIELDSILCLATPPAASATVLSSLADRIVVLDTDAAKLKQFTEVCLRASLANIETHLIEDFTGIALGDQFSLIYLASPGITNEFLGRDTLQARVRGLLSVDGIVKYETWNRSEGRASQVELDGLSRTGLHGRSYWLTPFRGEMRTALPTRQSDIAAFFFENVLYGQSLKKRILSRLGKVLSGVKLLDSVIPRRLFFLQKAESKYNSEQPPLYLTRLARRAGFDFDALRFGLSTRGKFNANKVIFYLFRTTSPEPEAIVKMTRAPEFNYRLENEFRTLAALRENEFVPDRTYPEALFLDYHAGLAVMAQGAVQGVPFRTRTTARPDCPLAQQAVNWLVELGCASANSSLVNAEQAADSLTVLFQRFVEIYSPDEADVSFISNQLARLRALRSAFPLVFQHGDPGTWNILVTDDNEVVFIDWEAGEPHGMPLWDIFYFMRTYASWVSRQQGNKNPLENFTRSFLEPSSFSRWLQLLVHDYCNKMGLAVELIEPLYYTCWMHRALKESTRLRESQLPQGHYFNLLKACITNRHTDTLTNLFSGTADGPVDIEGIRQEHLKEEVLSDKGASS